MITTKRTELNVINSFNDLMKDSKEKQKINQMVKQYSSSYFMSKLEDSSSLDMFEELSTRYQKYGYIITKNIIKDIIKENGYEEEYYDGAIDKNGFQIAKKRMVFDKRKFGDSFGDSLEEELNNLVIDDYFKNLNKALERYNFNLKIEKMKEKQQKDVLKSKQEQLDLLIADEVKETYSYYINHDEDKDDILYNFKYNADVITSMFERIAMKAESKLSVKISKQDIETKLNKEIKQFVRFKELEDDEDDEGVKIPLGWKAYAITKFINKMFK